MKKLIIIFGLLAASVAWGQAKGPDPEDSMATDTFENTVTAGSLVRFCQHSPHGYTAGQCIGMIDGYVTAITNLHPLVLDDKPFDPSLAPHVSRLQAVHVFLSYVGKHPETENQGCYGVLVAALLDAKLLTISPHR